jgi:hypothetical protein
MRIGKFVNYAVKCNAFLNIGRVIELFSAFYAIADKVANQDTWMMKGKICVSEIVYSLWL